jgi:YesN/AraC family two-component response regulator
MMPEINGLEFTKRIKNNEQTSHIPLILLTARKSEFQQLEGLRAGADDYITKPFNSDILREKIRNIFHTRDRIIRHFKEEYTILPAEIARSDRDKEFVERLVSAFLTHLSDTDFKNDELCREIGMSRTLLYAKIKSITGMTLNEFIQTIRLKEAAQRIAAGSHTVTEAMYDVGYNNLGYFRKIFKQQFHILPSDLKRNPGN